MSQEHPKFTQNCQCNRLQQHIKEHGRKFTWQRNKFLLQQRYLLWKTAISTDSMKLHSLLNPRRKYLFGVILSPFFLILLFVYYLSWHLWTFLIIRACREHNTSTEHQKLMFHRTSRFSSPSKGKERSSYPLCKIRQDMKKVAPLFCCATIFHPKLLSSFWFLVKFQFIPLAAVLTHVFHTSHVIILLT